MNLFNMTKVFGANGVKFLTKAAFKVKKYAPTICVVCGSIGTAVATGWAVKKSIDEAPEVLASCQQDIQIAKKIGSRGNIINAYGRSFLKLGKLYIGPALVEIVSVGGILYGYNMLSGRFVAMTATAAALERANASQKDQMISYRNALMEKYGPDFDKDVEFTYACDWNGPDGKSVEVENEDGTKEVITAKAVAELQGTITGVTLSPYAVIFDETSTEWSKDPEYNKMTLLRIQQTCNDMLHAKGHLFLNEVYRELGLPDTRAGQMVGWIDGMGDSYVDFGIYDVNYVPERAEFINNFEPSIILDFNVDGMIWDKI